jgi:hypothetical protein
MIQARLIVREREDGSVHVRLNARRAGEWHTVGIGDFRAEEWVKVAAFCADHGVPILREGEVRNGG